MCIKPDFVHFFLSFAAIQRHFLFLLLMLCHLALLALQASASNLAPLPIPVVLAAPPNQPIA